MGSPGVQFIGTADTVAAFASWEIEEWAVFQGRNILMSGCGADELESYLEMLSRSGTTAAYVLRCYSGLEENDLIDFKTPYAYCFTFGLSKIERVGSDRGSAMSGPGRSVGSMDVLTEKIHNAIIGKMGPLIDKMLGVEPEEKKATWEDILMGYAENPTDTINAINGVKQLFSGGATQPQLAAAAMGNVAPGPVQRAGGVTMPNGNPYPPDYQMRIVRVLNRLEKCDPDILIHLEQLATVAENKPDTYKMALGFLK